MDNNLRTDLRAGAPTESTLKPDATKKRQGLSFVDKLIILFIIIEIILIIIFIYHYFTAIRIG